MKEKKEKKKRFGFFSRKKTDDATLQGKADIETVEEAVEEARNKTGLFGGGCLVVGGGGKAEQKAAEKGGGGKLKAKGKRISGLPIAIQTPLPPRQRPSCERSPHFTNLGRWPLARRFKLATTSSLLCRHTGRVTAACADL